MPFKAACYVFAAHFHPQVCFPRVFALKRASFYQNTCTCILTASVHLTNSVGICSEASLWGHSDVSVPPFLGPDLGLVKQSLKCIKTYVFVLLLSPSEPISPPSQI